MLKKNLLAVSIIGLLFTLTSSSFAQDNPEEKNETKLTMQHNDMEKCMDKIAADSTMRMQMMGKMMSYTKDDDKGMMQMCSMMMENQGMHKMMMNMMNSEGMMGDGMMNQKSCCMGKKDGNMMEDSNESMDKSDHDSHH
ncbi:MAG TPA: hypothetical protein DHV28_04030 [Ignavibacteriales bacterium]|nr:hypothetical protein [Ignavibacteriales bacterium]